MTPIDRFISRVRFWLPGKRGAAAAEELRGVLGELVQERELAVGRALQATEIEALLAEFGRPEVFASRYSTSQPLVSAALMPAYVRVLGVCVLAVVLVQVGVTAVSLPGLEVGVALTTTAGRTVTGLLWSFTSVTLAFAALTRLYGPPPGAPEC